MSTFAQLISAATRLHRSALNCVAVVLDVVIWLVKIRRPLSWTPFSSSWLAKNTRPVSTMAKKSAKNGTAMNENSTAAEPLLSRRNLRKIPFGEAETADAGIPEIPLVASHLKAEIAETDCRNVSAVSNSPDPLVKKALTNPGKQKPRGAIRAARLYA